MLVYLRVGAFSRKSKGQRADLCELDVSIDGKTLKVHDIKIIDYGSASTDNQVPTRSFRRSQAKRVVGEPLRRLEPLHSNPGTKIKA